MKMRMRMRFGNLHGMGSLAGACGVLVMALAAQAGLAQQAKDAPAATAAPVVAQAKAFEPVAFGALAPGISQQAAKPVQSEEEDTAKPKKPGGEGIKVHGHWKIVIKNPDGTVDSTTEFENSLVSPGNGDILLSKLLTGMLAPGGFYIYPGNNLCGTASASATCYVEAPSNVGGGNCPTAQINMSCFPNLAVTFIAATNTTSAQVQLAGSFTAASNGGLYSVTTGVYFCSGPPPISASAAACTTSYGTPNGTLPSGSNGGGSYLFTNTNTAATVTAVGQIVQITVTISFS